MEKIWDFNKKNVWNISLKSKDKSGIEKLSMYFGKADTLIIFIMIELDYKQSCCPVMRQIDQNPFSITRVEEAFLKQPSLLQAFG